MEPISFLWYFVSDVFQINLSICCLSGATIGLFPLMYQLCLQFSVFLATAGYHTHANSVKSGKYCFQVVQRIQDFLEVFFMFFQDKMRYLMVSKKNNPLFV